jgi:hypothetical protein
VTNIGFVQPEIQGVGRNFVLPGLFRALRRSGEKLSIKD